MRAVARISQQCYFARRWPSLKRAANIIFAALRTHIGNLPFCMMLMSAYSAKLTCKQAGQCLLCPMSSAKLVSSS